MMKNKAIQWIFFVAVVIWGCSAPVKMLSKKPVVSEEEKMAQLYLKKGQHYEYKKDPVSAMNQYKLAHTVSPQNKVAKKNIDRLGRNLHNLAEKHFQEGLKYHEKGQYRAAQHQFLLALRFWPDYPEAVKMLSIRERVKAATDIEHIIKPGESLSKIAKLYYGDYHKFPLIAEYNKIADATKVEVGQTIKIPQIEGIPFLAGKQKEKMEKMSEEDLPRTKEKAKQDETIKDEADKKEIEKDLSITPQKTAEDKEIRLVRKADLDQPKDEIDQEKEMEELIAVDSDIVEDEITTGELGKMDEGPEEEIDVVAMYFDQGVTLFNEGKYPEAIVEFNKFANVNTDDKNVLEYLYKSHFEQGAILFAKQDYLSARKEFEASLRYKSDCEKCHEYIRMSEDAYKEIHYVKGISYFKEEKLAEALEEWELVRAIDPEYKGVEQNINKAKTLLRTLEEIKKRQQNP